MRPSQRILGSLVTAVALVACGSVADQPGAGTARAEPTLVDPSLEASLIVDGLAEPTQMAFTGNGSDLFVIERSTGRVRLVSGGTSTTVLELPAESQYEGGLLGLALHPQFATNGQAYVTYSAALGENEGRLQYESRLSRFTWDGSQFGGETVLRSQPYAPVRHGDFSHEGGPLRFGHDGKLYAASHVPVRNGIEQNNTDPEAVSSDSGGIFRLNDDGSIPDDNPFVSSSDGRLHPWFGYGLGSGAGGAYGLAFDPATELLWATEALGPYEEVNVIARGFNGGSLKVFGPSSRDPKALDDLVHLPNSAYSDPEVSWFGYGSSGITAIEFLPTSLLNRSYGQGALMAAFFTETLYWLPLNEARDGFDLTGELADLVVDEDDTEQANLAFGTGFQTPIDVQVGPDGAIYVLSMFGGTIYRIAPKVLPLVGDANDDGEVGAADYAIWAAQFGQTGVGLAADWDRNLSVGTGDYALWAANFGNTQAGASVPEPASGVLAALGAVIGWLSIVRGRIRRTS